MDELLEFLRGRADELTLDRAALQLAKIEHPGLKPEPYLEILDRHAAELGARLGDQADGRAFVVTANEYLFVELGFAGNTADYYDPSNSCLDQVLTARKGIPITLGLVYMEIARRLRRPVRGIGLPGHFLVQYDDGLFSTFLDPFQGGRLLTQKECFEIARRASGAVVREDRQLLAPVSKRQILLRMLGNLRGVYLTRRVYRKALQVLKLLIAANPGAAQEYEKEARAVNQYLARLN